MRLRTQANQKRKEVQQLAKKEDKRILPIETADGKTHKCEVTQSLWVNRMEFCIGTAPIEGYPFFVATHKIIPSFGMGQYDNIKFFSDYIEALDTFHERVTEQVHALQQERVERGLPMEINAAEHCDCSIGLNYAHQFVAVKANVLYPEFQCADHQLMYATGGNGCNPEALGRSVFGVNVYTGEQQRYDRYDILGVIKPECMPEWAKERAAGIIAKHGPDRERGGHDDR